jgi:hypothetical protein
MITIMLRLPFIDNLPVTKIFADPGDRIVLEVKTTRTGEETPEAMVAFLSGLTNMKKAALELWWRGVPFSLELAVIDQTIHFYVTIPAEYRAFLESQLTAQYPKSLIAPARDFLADILEDEEKLAVGQMKLTHGSVYPLRSYRDFKEIDPFSSLLGLLSKSQLGDKIAIQILLLPVNKSWQSQGHKAAKHKTTDSSGKEVANPWAKLIEQKISMDGFKTAIRIAVRSDDKMRSQQLIRLISNSLSGLNNPSGNGLVFRRTFLWQRKRLINAMSKRSRYFMPNQILNVEELSTLYHFPSAKLAKIHNISWYKSIFSDPPEDLPIAERMSEEEKKETNFFGRTEYKNRMTTFGIKSTDRRRHMYIIGKTGTGKSTLIANMAINDIRNNKGVCIVDPHGDLCEKVLDYIPSYRINDVVYLDPSDLDYAFMLNPLEVTDNYQMELVVSGIVGIFHKIYGNSWGPRLEYILRNTLFTLIHLPNPTLLMVPELLTNEKFRKEVLTQVHDPILKNYWEGEFASMPDRLRSESISPILNKVGQFISSRFIRNILQNPRSTINLEKIMNERKILLLNLSQGKLGEDNSALLGAMIITKIQLAAMNRVSVSEHERQDFYLYVDEFQNFATSSFIKILSEARKYRLNLILANQYISQIPQDVRGAIFGNAGTIFSFLLGSEDASFMAREFRERFKDEDLLSLGNYQGITKLAIDSVTQEPFLCYTLPMPKSITQNRTKVITNSRMRYMKRVNG